jgi:calcineurin-like phosphoesterase family protein
MEWFTADWHLFHKNIIRYCNRPFETVEEMNNEIIQRTNALVKPNDTLRILGDFCFSRASFDNAKWAREQIKCKNVHLITGNHDDKSVHSLFSSVNSLGFVKFERREIILCHYAMYVWNKKHYGSWHLYGHSHGTIEERLNELEPDRKSLDVGVDNAARLTGLYSPFSFDYLEDLFYRNEPEHEDFFESRVNG